MFTLLHSVNNLEKNYSLSSKIYNNNKIKHILKSKENIIHHKYCKELKRKLKKYRLRPDGQEDQEVLDVSKILVSSLKIKSPNYKEEDYVLQNELRPKNYLFKMGRRKQISTKSESDILIANENKINEVRSASTSDQHVEKIKNSKSETNVVNSDSLSTKENKKKETNAFKLLMESRNKSIGSNSPGKVIILEEGEDQESIEKRSIKVKRNLLLQKMAEAKGSMKNKEIEEFQDKIIKKKMDKRAERLKSLILRYDSKPTGKIKRRKVIETETIKDSSRKIDEDKVPHKLSLVDLFQDSTKALEKPTTKYVSDEETEFLKKLSPSLRKKENMLSYFKKIEKDNSIANEDDQDDNTIIKVKLNMKSKKRVKKKKLSINKEPCDDVKIIDSNDSVTISNVCTEKVFPDKNNTKMNKETNVIKDIENNEVDVMRPRRNIKRPAKYIDEVLISSSDEELHIFTPKKKKHPENKIDVDSGLIKQGKEEDLTFTKETREVTKSKLKDNQSNGECKSKLSLKIKKELRESTKSKLKIKSGDQQKKPTKLAPIFNAKPQLDVAALEAKQKFLSSGVPDKLKKVVEKQNNFKIGSNVFDTVVHIQQIEPSSVSEPNAIDYNFSICEDDFEFTFDSKDLFKKLLSGGNQFKEIRKINEISSENEIQKVLHCIKKEYPKFPVYRTYRLLKDKNRGVYRDSSFLDLDNSVEIINEVIDVNIDSPDRLNWTDKYKPMMSKEIIGNFETTKELKKWLVPWTENDVRNKKNNTIDSDSSDFYYSDTDSKDSVRVTNNLLILNGPVGSGKTSIVYAVAFELAIKVLEVNASSKRTGKIMLQDLQEATQSHKVNRGKSSSQEYSQKSQEAIQVEILTKTKKRGRPKKSHEKLSKKIESVCNDEASSQPLTSQDSTRTCMSLILIDDADIVFEQDDGFCSAIVQLVHCSKRPVILITTSTTCLHLQKFIQTAKIINTHPLQPRMLGTWLDIMCLVENNSCSPGMGSHLLNYFHGDIRKTINYLQFYFSKFALINDKTVARCNDLKLNVEDENSSMSWCDREIIEENTDIVIANSENTENLTWCLPYERNNLLHFEFPIKLFNIWWSLPQLLNISSGDLHMKEMTEKKYSARSKRSLEILAISSALDAISLSDYFRRGQFDNDITDSPWLNKEQDSVSEQETLDHYNKYDTQVDEISHALVTGSIVHFQKTLAIEHDNTLKIPGANVQRDRDKTISRHNKLTNFLNSSSTLDRRALGLDYWSNCRTICRIEKSKTDSNVKRNNRYCHYLKSLNVLCNNDYFDNLGKSLHLDKP